MKRDIREVLELYEARIKQNKAKIGPIAREIRQKNLDNARDVQIAVATAEKQAKEKLAKARLADDMKKNPLKHANNTSLPKAERIKHLATAEKQLRKRSAQVSSQQEHEDTINHFRKEYEPAYKSVHGNSKAKKHKKHLQDMYNVSRGHGVERSWKPEPRTPKFADPEKTRGDKKPSLVKRAWDKVGRAAERMDNWVGGKGFKTHAGVRLSGGSGRMRRENFEEPLLMQTIQRVVKEYRQQHTKLPGTVNGHIKKREPGHQRTGRRMYKVAKSQTAMVNRPPARDRIDG